MAITYLLDEYLDKYLDINSGRWYISHVPSTFATANTHANVFFVFLPVGISKEWRQIVSANCDFESETGPIVPMFTGLLRNTWETAKIAHELTHIINQLAIYIHIGEES